MPDLTLVPLVAHLADQRRPDLLPSPPPGTPAATGVQTPQAVTPVPAVDRSARAGPQEDPRPQIIPAFRFVPEGAPLRDDPAQLARDYARAARDGGA